MNKNGSSFLDWFFIIATLFIGAIAILVGTLIIVTVNNTNIFASVPTAQAAIDSSYNVLTGFDNMFLFVLVGLSIFVLASSYFALNHPVFFIPGFILLCIAVVVGAITSNTFWKFTVTEAISSTANLFPKMTYIMEHIPYYIAFMGMAAAAIMYVAYQRQ